jgi:hypothetical protein
MSDCATNTMSVIQQLSHRLAIEVELNYMTEEMAECGGALVPLYLARRLGATSEAQEMVIKKIESAIATDPHYSCTGCKAMFADTDDLGFVTQAYIDRIEPGEMRPIGICPVCQGAVHPHT